MKLRKFFAGEKVKCRRMLIGRNGEPCIIGEVEALVGNTDDLYVVHFKNGDFVLREYEIIAL